MSSPVIDSASTSNDSLAPPSISCSSPSENGVCEEQNKEVQEPSTHNSMMEPEEPEAVYSIEFADSAEPDTFMPTLGAVVRESCVPQSAQLFPSRESARIFYLCIDKEISAQYMSWKGLNSLVSVSRVEYRHIQSLLDRKNIISLLDLPMLTMCSRGSEVLAHLENDIQKLSVSDRKENAVPDAAKADPTTMKRTLIVTIIKDELKTDSEERIRELANDACFDSTAKDVQVVVDPLTDDHFFLLFVRASHILDNIAGIRRGRLEGKITARKVTEATPVVQSRFLELVANSSRCFPVEVREKEKKTKSDPAASIRVSVAVTPKSEPSTPPSELSRRADRGPTSGHVARRLVEGSLGIRSTVTREQVKQENQRVAAFAAEKRATRQKQQAVTNQVKAAFE
ncbi:hypothetical protein PENTCL1PPCAC_29056 [Pristionchus entomophagus]|uniref:Uncharacterized protein n=1 Tax=Pristionchus entomophagus TaxID=358040 RepID=A0AAV5UKP8_9BILA|nr:hypothetical protein PENTCL1PPCAC_29056 [Pristionchus entomophagus]